MTNDTRATQSASVQDAGAPIHLALVAASAAPCSRACGGSAGPCGAAGAGEGGVSAAQERGCISGGEQRPGKLSYYTLRAIETEAENAARDNRKPVDACSWPFGSREGTHWLACYLLAGGAP